MDGGDLHGLIDRQREAFPRFVVLWISWRIAEIMEAGTGFDAHFPRRVLAAVGGALQCAAQTALNVHPEYVLVPPPEFLRYIHGVGILHRDVS